MRGNIYTILHQILQKFKRVKTYPIDESTVKIIHLYCKFSLSYLGCCEEINTARVIQLIQTRFRLIDCWPTLVACLWYETRHIASSGGNCLNIAVALHNKLSEGPVNQASPLATNVVPQVLSEWKIVIGVIGSEFITDMLNWGFNGAAISIMVIASTVLHYQLCVRPNHMQDTNSIRVKNTIHHTKQMDEAFLNAFTMADLRRLVKFALEEDLMQITNSRNYTDTVFELLEWAERRGKLHVLISAALEENPDNVLLQKLRSEL